MDVRSRRESIAPTYQGIVLLEPPELHRRTLRTIILLRPYTLSRVYTPIASSPPYPGEVVAFLLSSYIAGPFPVVERPAFSPHDGLD
jgi:hypothetical protein